MDIRKTIATVIAAAMVLSVTGCANSENPNDSTENVLESIKIKTDYKAMWKILPEIEETPIENLVYEYDVELSGMAVTGYKAHSPKVRIPDKIEGEPVVGVNLKDCTITEIIMPDTVKRAVLNKTCLQYANYPLSLDTYEDLFGEISRYQSYSAPGSANEAFNGSTLEAIYIPNGIKYIPSLAFKDCSSLKEIHLPNSVDSLEEDCFQGCKNLISVTFPDNLSYMAASSFSGGKDYENIIFTYKGKKYTHENANELYKLINFRDGMQIRNGVLIDTLEDITEAVIPDNITKINNSAFRNRKDLRSVIIPNSVIEIGGSAFSGSENVVVMYKGKTYDYEHIDFLNDAVNLGESGMLIEGGILKDVSRELTEVVIPNNTTIIENAFQGCINLIKVTLPDTAHTIDQSAFEDCTNVRVTYKGKTYNYEQLDDLYNLINYGDSSISAQKSTYPTTKGYTPPFEVYSKGIYMVNLDTDSVVVSQNSDEKLYPNSTTMIMTCLVTLENISDLSAKVDCPHECFDEFWSENPNFMGVSTARIESLQSNVTYIDCLYGLMLASGCEAANIIAYNVGGGSIDRFVDMMNETAQKIGCENTHFSNPHGLFEEDNYTTAYDMYLITKYAIDNYSLFMEICDASSYSFPANQYNPDGYIIYNENPLISPSSDYYLEYAHRIKMGSIDKYYDKDGNVHDGGRCLVSLAQKNGYTYLTVTMQAPYFSETGERINYNVIDHYYLYNWAFDEFEYRYIIDAGQRVASMNIENGENYEVFVVATDSCYALIPKSLEDFGIQTNKCIISENPILAPVQAGKFVGYLEVTIRGETIAVIPLITERAVSRKDTDSTSD